MTDVKIKVGDIYYIRSVTPPGSYSYVKILSINDETGRSRYRFCSIEGAEHGNVSFLVTETFQRAIGTAYQLVRNWNESGNLTESNKPTLVSTDRTEHDRLYDFFFPGMKRSDPSKLPPSPAAVLGRWPDSDEY